jgi:hypothetical protein
LADQPCSAPAAGGAGWALAGGSGRALAAAARAALEGPDDAPGDAAVAGARGAAGTTAEGLGGAGAVACAGAATAVTPRNAGTVVVGPHRATCPKERVSHSTARELLPGRHQRAPVAKKKTWMAIQRVRKNRCATTMPRQRAAISLQIPAMSEATASTAPATPSQNPVSGSGPPGGADDGGTGGCGTNATVSAPQNCGGILI